MKKKNKKLLEMPERLFQSIRRKLAALDRNFNSEVESDINDLPFLSHEISKANGLKSIRKDGILHFRIDENKTLLKYPIPDLLNFELQLKKLIDLEFNRWTCDG